MLDFLSQKGTFKMELNLFYIEKFQLETMRWDIESRKLDYDKTDSQFSSTEMSFEQELDNLKTILSKNESTTDRAKLQKRILLSLLGLVVTAGVFMVLYLLK
jgi:hypothetical protein